MPLPSSIRLLTQRIDVEEAPGLHGPADEGGHAHRLYGTYDEPESVITMDDALSFERQRESFLHENLHAIMCITQLDAIFEEQMGHGGEEHVVSALAPVLLAWLRDNPAAVAFLSEVQP